MLALKDVDAVIIASADFQHAPMLTQAAESGKPANIIEKMVEGGVAKFIAENTLLGQPFVKGDGKQTVGDLLKGK